MHPSSDCSLPHPHQPPSPIPTTHPDPSPPPPPHCPHLPHPDPSPPPPPDPSALPPPHRPHYLLQNVPTTSKTPQPRAHPPPKRVSPPPVRALRRFHPTAFAEGSRDLLWPNGATPMENGRKRALTLTERRATDNQTRFRYVNGEISPLR
ncbi:hypothetical protein RJT34_10413 [Clitoria ternatea]|uniref:Uncharacterized protein n=1 Tax=Clitoria ternatea TaxID=43366 RepID=A0AAN9K9Y2_CLITE